MSRSASGGFRSIAGAVLTDYNPIPLLYSVGERRGWEFIAAAVFIHGCH